MYPGSGGLLIFRAGPPALTSPGTMPIIGTGEGGLNVHSWSSAWTDESAAKSRARPVPRPEKPQKSLEMPKLTPISDYMPILIPEGVLMCDHSDLFLMIPDSGWRHFHPEFPIRGQVRSQVPAHRWPGHARFLPGRLGKQRHTAAGRPGPGRNLPRP